MTKRDRRYLTAIIGVAVMLIPAIVFAASYETKVVQKWQKFDQQMYKYEIPAGWLVRYGSQSMVFIPDAKHTWK